MTLDESSSRFSFLFGHDLRANATRLSRGKTASHFSGSCLNGTPRDGSAPRTALHGPRRNAASVRQRRCFRLIEIALSEVVRDFVERALLPFLGLSQPENPALGIKRCTLAANLLLTAYLDEPVHEPSTPVV